MHARLVRERKSKSAAGDGPGDDKPLDTWFVEDMGSKNGTFIGSQRLEREEQRLVTPGTRITLAHVTVVFDGPSARVTGAEGTGTIARRLVSDLFLAAPETNAPTLTVVEGPSSGSVLRLVARDKDFTIGRSRSCALCIKVHELSRTHAAFKRGATGVVVRDLGSKNGVQVNGVTVSETQVSDGDVIQMGPVKLRLAGSRGPLHARHRGAARQPNVTPAGPCPYPRAVPGLHWTGGADRRRRPPAPRAAGRRR